MLNKKIIASVLLLSSSILFANVVGVGQIGDKFVYKIHGTLVSLSVGDIVDGCTVRSGSGLQCDENFDGVRKGELAIETIQEKINKLKTIGQLSNENSHNLEKIKQLSAENSNKTTMLTSLSLENKQLIKKLFNSKQIYITKINKRNKIINKLSKVLNSQR